MPTRRAICLSLSAYALTSCGAGSKRTEPLTRSTPARSIPTPPVLRANFGDNDPVDFKAPRPSRFAVHGVDAARFQSAADWTLAREAGVNFAFIKATEGGDLLDPMFKSHWRGANRAGIATGAYHFYYFCTPAEVQARWFIKNVPKRSGMLPPVLDLEWNPLSPTCKRRPDGAVVRREARIFLSALEAHYGQRPIIYTTPGFHEDTGIGKIRAAEFWLRTTAKTPREAYPGQAWTFWQYSATGVVPGFTGEVDLNLFNGSRADWAAWLERRRVA